MLKNAKKILVVEDDDNIRLTLTCYIEDQGFDVYEAVNGKKGLALVKEVDPDLIITDLRMPVMNGIELMKKVKNEDPDIPIIVISGTNNIQDVVDTLHYGAYDYLLKPFHDLGILGTAIKKALEKSENKHENDIYSKNLEDRIKKNTQELENAKELLNSIVSTIPDIIYRLDDKGNIIFINDAVKNYGYKVEELIGKNVFSIIHPEDRDKAAERINERRTGDRSTKSLELRLLNKNREDIRFELKSNGISDEVTMSVDAEGLYHYDNGQFIGTQGIARDLTERINAQKEAMKLNEQLFHAQKMESIGRIAGGLAHDFNNVLSGILGYGQLLEMKYKDESSTEGKAAAVIVRGATKSAKLVKQLLNFSRKEEPLVIPMDINIAIHDALALSELSFNKKINVTKELDDDLENVDADSDKMNQVFTNLIINARDAMQDGGSLGIYSKQVYLNKEDVKLIPGMIPGKYIQIKVQDTGNGMEQDVIDKIFEPFFTTKSSDMGTGLGLSNVYKIIKMHNGFIEVESTVGEGTTFIIYLPASNKNEEAVAEVFKSCDME